MASFVVLQHDDPTAKTSEKTVFVPDAFSIVAFAIPVVWLFWHRLWFAGVIVLCGFVAIVALVQYPQYAPAIIPLNLMLGILVATEGSAWRMSALKRVGYEEGGVVEAESLDDAQIIWATTHVLDESPIKKPIGSFGSRAQVSADDDLIFGISDGGRI